MENQNDWLRDHDVRCKRTHLALASLTRTLGLAKSSRRRWLCSVNLRSFSSDIDCYHDRKFLMTRSHCAGLLTLCGREFMTAITLFRFQGKRENESACHRHRKSGEGTGWRNGGRRERATRKRRATTSTGGNEFSLAPYRRSFNNHFLPHRHNHNVPAPLFQSQAQNCPEFMLSWFKACKSSSLYWLVEYSSLPQKAVGIRHIPPLS